jgi:hypothetical protein
MSRTALFGNKSKALQVRPGFGFVFGRPRTIATFLLRDLKRIHSHICSVAYPVLERAGALQPSRLRLIEPDEGSTDDKDAASAG